MQSCPPDRKGRDVKAFQKPNFIHTDFSKVQKRRALISKKCFRNIRKKFEMGGGVLNPQKKCEMRFERPLQYCISTFINAQIQTQRF